MSDITQAQLVAAIPTGDPFASWWSSAPALPSNTTIAQFLFHTLVAANNAAATANANLPTGSKISGYGTATLSAPTLQSDGVTYSIPFSATVSGRLAVSYTGAPVFPTNA